ncbi:unnamed protein product [Choristocarpus tenellus]
MDAVEDSDEEIDVTVKLKEKLWINMSCGTNIAQKEYPMVEATGVLLNVFGHGERVIGGYNGNANLGGQNEDTFARFILPKIRGSDVAFEVEGKKAKVDMEEQGSFKELLKGAKATAWTYDANDARHSVAAEVFWRDIMPKRHPNVPYAYDASLDVMMEARPSVKGSVSYTYTEDQRDNRITPTAGSFYETSVEGAGLLGDVKFLKGTLELQKHIPMWRGLSLALCGYAGALMPFSEGVNTRLNDRFFLGGPCTLRGFESFGAGPRAPREEGGRPRGDALGGDITYTVSAALSVPFRNASFEFAASRMHLFANMGHLTSWKSPLRNYVRDTRISVGAGTIWNAFGVLRVEANVIKVLQRCQNDLIRPFQFGINVTFR